jgi:homopolymeric O-antigen transport system ATP-binding protein
MLLETDTVLEVDGLSKLYSRQENSTRKRMAGIFVRALYGQAPKPPTNLNKGEFWSLKDISFSLKRGEAIGVIGFNGAGKTTLLRILSGQILPDEGEVRILGNTAAMIDLTAGFDPRASGRRNIFLRGAMLGRSHKEVEASLEEIIEFSELGDAIDAPFSTYSSGMSMRLAFSVMIVSEPDILFIDEILSVGDFRFQQKCLSKIREIRERVAFVLVSHSMANIKLFCNKAIVLDQGEIAFMGDPEEAISLYEEMRFPAKTSKQEKRSEILRPQYHNDDVISELEHYWCDEDGRPIDEIFSGEALYFRVRFKLNYKPRNLIIGIPVWTENGVYVTGFSTNRAGRGLDVEAGELVEYMLTVPNLAFNPGEYVSNIAINDGPECLYRGGNPVIMVASSGEDFWGVAMLPHEWKMVSG